MLLCAGFVGLRCANPTYEEAKQNHSLPTLKAVSKASQSGSGYFAHDGDPKTIEVLGHGLRCTQREAGLFVVARSIVGLGKNRHRGYAVGEHPLNRRWGFVICA